MNLLRTVIPALGLFVGSCNLAASADLFQEFGLPYIDGFQVDGTPRIKIGLAGLMVASGVNISLELSHVLVGNESEVHSAWRIIALQSSFYPSGIGRFEWIAPGGAKMLFDASGQRVSPGPEASFRFVDPDTVEIKCEPWRYVYFKGQIRSARSSELELEFRSKAGLIEMISAVRYGVKREILRCAFAPDKQPLLLLCGSKQVRFSYASGQLSSFESQSETTYHFAYDRGLLSAVTYPEGRLLRLSWRKVESFGPGDCLYYWPYCIERIGDETAAYQLYGDIVKISVLMSPRAKVLVWNRRTNRLSVDE